MKFNNLDTQIKTIDIKIEKTVEWRQNEVGRLFFCSYEIENNTMDSVVEATLYANKETIIKYIAIRTLKKEQLI